MCLCQQSLKVRATEYNDSLEENYRPVAPTDSDKTEIKDVYGKRLDDLNSKYDHLLSLFQPILESSSDGEANKKVSESILSAPVTGKGN